MLVIRRGPLFEIPGKHKNGIALVALDFSANYQHTSVSKTLIQSLCNSISTNAAREKIVISGWQP